MPQTNILVKSCSSLIIRTLKIHEGRSYMRRPKIALMIGLQLTGVGSEQPQLPFLARGS